MPTSRLVALALALPCLAGCGDIFGQKDAKQPGTPLGTFHVTATQTANTCGDKALGAPASWEFDVKLARAAGTLYWDNGAQQVSGSLSDGTQAFSVAGTVVEDMRAGGESGSPCSVERDDAATGALVGKDADISSVSGQLSFSFHAQAGTQCEDLVQTTAQSPKNVVFAALPCSMTYTFAAPRTEAP
jgi:hypothetical protein